MERECDHSNIVIYRKCYLIWQPIIWNLIIQHLRRVVQIAEVFIFTTKEKAMSEWNMQIWGTCSKKTSKSTSTVASPDPLVSYSFNIFNYEYSRKQNRTLVSRYPNGILLWLVVQPKYRGSNKTLPVRT
jgi:hypothetical protein